MEKKPHKTAQRAAILEYLKDSKSHPSILDIYQHVSKRLSTISIGTIYNTMDLLKKEGLVLEIPVLHGEGRRYDSNPNPHDHLLCSVCGAIFDINLNIDHSMLLTEEKRKGFEITGMFTSIYGKCPQCKNKEIISKQS